MLIPADIRPISHINGMREGQRLSDDSNLTAREFLNAIFEQILPHVSNPKAFAREWERLTGQLDKQIKDLNKLEADDDHAEQWKRMCKRDDMSRQLILLVRTQLANSYLFDDLWLQHSQGCSVLSDYAEMLNGPGLERRRGDAWSGHTCDGINWTSYERRMMPDFPEKRLDFRGSTTTGQPYYGCLDHAISNLICKVWGFSGFIDTKPHKPERGWFPSTAFNIGWWKDSSMYLAVMLCLGVNILDDQPFLEDLKDTQQIDIDIIPEPKEKLRAVLNAKSIRPKLWARIQDQIGKRAKEAGAKASRQQ